MSRELKPSPKHIIVYRQPRNKKCPNCEILENFLRVNDIEFDSINLITAEAMTEMAMHYIFPMFTPALQINDDIYYRELWKTHGKILNISVIKRLVDSSKIDWKEVEDVNKICEGGVCKI